MQMFRMLCPPQVLVKRSKVLLHLNRMKLFKRIKQMNTKYFKQVVDTDIGL